jgi:hypothetical protein
MRTGMRNGALVIMDALGYKGIWQRKECKADPRIVLRKLRKLKRRSSDALAYARKAFKRVENLGGLKAYQRT